MVTDVSHTSMLSHLSTTSISVRSAINGFITLISCVGMTVSTQGTESSISDTTAVVFSGAGSSSSVPFHMNGTTAMNISTRTPAQYFWMASLSIALALKRFEDDVLSSIPRIAPISLWDIPSRTDILNTFPYC